MQKELPLYKMIAALEREGHTESALVRFDAFVRDSDKAVIAIEDLLDLEAVSFAKNAEEDLTFLFKIVYPNRSKGLVLIDLHTHTDPISIEMIDSLGLPNLSELQDSDEE